MGNSEEPLVKAVTGLMTAHDSTQQAVVTMSKGLANTNKAVASLQTAASALQESVGNLEVSVVDLEASLAEEGTLLHSLLEAVTSMAYHSTDTQKRIAALEADVAELKARAS